MVINYDIKDLKDFKSRLKSTTLLLSPDSILKVKSYEPCGEITRKQAEEFYKLSKKNDDKKRKLHKFVENFFELRTHLSTDILFKTMIDLMDITGKDKLSIEDMENIYSNAEDFYKKYTQLQSAEERV